MVTVLYVLGFMSVIRSPIVALLSEIVVSDLATMSASIYESSLSVPAVGVLTSFIEMVY